MHPDNNIPYYHSNYQQNLDEIIRVTRYLLDKYGHAPRKRAAELVHPENFIHVEWEVPDLKRSYLIEQNITVPEPHAIFYVADTYGDEQEIRAYIYQESLVNGKPQITQMRQTLQRTAANQKKWEEDTAEEREKARLAGRNFILLPETTSEIVQHTEMVLHVLDNAENHLNLA